MKRLSSAGGEAKEKVQHAVDWMFPMAVEWFGLPDGMKRHSGQLEYRLKGLTNDELRQAWMSATVPLCEGIGIDVPAHWDEAKGEFVLEYPFPCEYDESEKRWLFDEGEIGWTQVFERWKGRGPSNKAFVEAIQEGRPFRRMLEAA
jgi:ring-1,2-phenylacetyl-CoA epoxidase subunit PaaA